LLTKGSRTEIMAQVRRKTVVNRQCRKIALAGLGE
jgi:hypothetical protein